MPQKRNRKQPRVFLLMRLHKYETKVYCVRICQKQLKPPMTDCLFALSEWHYSVTRVTDSSLALCSHIMYHGRHPQASGLSGSKRDIQLQNWKDN